jgi:hypothetical protein
MFINQRVIGNQIRKSTLDSTRPSQVQKGMDHAYEQMNFLVLAFVFLSSVSVAAALDSDSITNLERDNDRCRNKREKRKRCEARGGEFEDCKCRIRPF